MNNQLTALAGVLRERKLSVVARWKAVVSELPRAAAMDTAALRDHIPQFIDEMIAAIASRDASAVVGSTGLGSPTAHGIQRLGADFNIKEVVVEYSILRTAVLDTAHNAGLRLTVDDYHVVNHIIDDAIADAVAAFAGEQASERLRERTEHLAFVAHDVRTPLNAISLTAALLSEELGPGAHELAEMLRVLQRNVERIEALVQRILQEEHSQKVVAELALVRRNVDVWPIVHQLFQDLRPITDSAQIKVRNVVPFHLTAYADAGLLIRTLQNLISNAVKFAPAGEVEVGARETPAGIECWVRDNGAGIPPERLDTIFKKHHTDDDPNRAGFGLGLTIVKQIVEQHGGEVSVESRAGQGATFRFTIPGPGQNKLAEA